MSTHLLELIERARKIEMTPEEAEAQRISFVYGNTRFENDNITLETVVKASADLKAKTLHGSTIQQ
jgi:hypothetical protein